MAAPDTQKLGAAAELRVMSELLLRGFNPAKSFVENGADLILDDGRKIEVKCSSQKLKREAGFGISIRCGHHYSGSSRKILVNCDFVICWSIVDDDFFIIPYSEVKHLTSLGLPMRGRKSKYEKFRNNWNILKGGD